ncbi:MAG: gamma-glutamylcyclotransferase family protein [Dehalococcoides mccartyi]|uniref:gamma-glutamylcyclotransferase family protein n=1 Tax=Dehalococcoides mccartyi TaxID=61435 RepID=UPI0030F8E862
MLARKQIPNCSGCEDNKDKLVWYFAYGSNMNIEQMISRIGKHADSDLKHIDKKPWIEAKKAKLVGYSLRFNHLSSGWDGMTANIVQSDQSDDTVFGVVYYINGNQLDKIHSCEGKITSKKIDIDIICEGKTLQAITFCFNDSGDSKEPPKTYLEKIMAGLKDHGYEQEVINAVNKIANPNKISNANI